MLAIILMIKQILIFLTQKIVFGKRVEKSKARPLEWSANSSIKKNVERVSKVLKSSKHHNIWVQMKEHLNIQYLLFKYLVFFPFLCFILAIRYFKTKHVNLSFIFSFFFFFFPNVILQLSIIFQSIKYHLWMRVKDFFFIKMNFFKKCHSFALI